MPPRAEDENDLQTLKDLAESIAEDAQHLVALERFAATLSPDNPVIEDLAAEASALAEKMRRETARQETLTADAARDVDRDDSAQS